MNTTRTKIVAKVAAVCTSLLLAAGLITATATAASAHTDSVSATCEALSVNLSSYAAEVPAKDATYKTVYQRYSWNGGNSAAPTTTPPGANWTANTTNKGGSHASDPVGVAFKEGHGPNASWHYWTSAQVVDKPAVPAKTNTVKVVIDGVTVEDRTFSTSFNKVYTFSDKYVAHTWSVVVVAWDDARWNVNKSGTSTPCVRPDVLDSDAAVTTTPGACTTAGSASVTTANFVTWDGVLDTTPGAHSEVFTAVQGHKFANGSATKTVNYTVPDKDTSLCPDNTVCENVTDGGTATDLNPNGWYSNDTRSAGHVVEQNGGWRIYTDTDVTGSPDPRKVQYEKVVEFPLSQTGQVTLNYTNTAGALPGVKERVDFDNDGDIDGTLVWESVYGGTDFWLTNDSDPSLTAPQTGGGYGSNRHGTIDEWLTVYPNAVVKRIQFGVGSGVNADGVLHSFVIGCAEYKFSKVAPPEQREPWDDVTYGEYTDGEWTCEDTEAPTSRTVSTVTVTYTYEVQNGQYVEVEHRSEPVITTEYSTRPLTQEEIGECPLIPGDIGAVCEGNVPYLAYDADLPAGWTGSDDATITISRGADSYTYPGTYDLSGKLLWPGASDGAVKQWPGYELVGDEYVNVGNDNYGWTREGAFLTISVNPSLTVAIEYPAGTSECANPPVKVDEPKTPEGELANTGASLNPRALGFVAGGVILAGALVLLFIYLARRRNRDSE